MKAVPNGETKERAVVVFGASMEEVCDIPQPYFRFCFVCSLKVKVTGCFVMFFSY